MQRSPFPIFVFPAPALRAMDGPDLERVAALALRATLLSRRSLEIAHQQIVWRGRHFAFSARISAKGELIIEIDVGDPRLAGRIVLEEDMQRAARGARDKARPARRA
ncbi:MAG: hypothetical protein J0H11_09610 [Rhizobiales bacterium]|nr:hypothetical protein [Hyphomicrobiales bacterium]